MAQRASAYRHRRQRADRVRRSGARRADAAASTVPTARASRATTRSTCSASRTATRITTRRRRSSPAATPATFAARVRARRAVDLLRPALSRALSRRLATLALIVVPCGVHGTYRRSALGGAAARARDREPVLRARGGAGRHASGRTADMGPLDVRRPLGRLAGRSGGRCRHRRRDRRATGDRRGPQQASRIAASDARGALTQPFVCYLRSRLYARQSLRRYRQVQVGAIAVRIHASQQQRRSRS